MSQRESNTVYPRNPVDEMDLTLISGPTVTAPTSALTEGPGPAPGGGEALSESNRSENYRLLRIKLASVEMLLLLHTKGDDWDAGEETCSGAADVGARACCELRRG